MCTSRVGRVDASSNCYIAKITHTHTHTHTQQVRTPKVQALCWINIHNYFVQATACEIKLLFRPFNLHHAKGQQSHEDHEGD